MLISVINQHDNPITLFWSSLCPQNTNYLFEPSLASMLNVA